MLFHVAFRYQSYYHILLIAECSRQTRSISWLLLASPGHQQSWYGQCTSCGSVLFMRVEFSYLRQLDVAKMEIYFCGSSNQVSTQRANYIHNGYRRERLASQKSYGIKWEVTILSPALYDMLMSMLTNRKWLPLTCNQHVFCLVPARYSMRNIIDNGMWL